MITASQLLKFAFDAISSSILASEVHVGACYIGSFVAHFVLCLSHVIVGEILTLQ